MPRKSRAALEMEAFLLERRQAQLAELERGRDEPGDDLDTEPEAAEAEPEPEPGPLLPPPPPDDLEPFEAAMWREINAGRQIDPAKLLGLHSALLTHAILRKLRESVLCEGVVIPNRDLNPRPNPALITLRQLQRAFNEAMAVLHLPRW